MSKHLIWKHYASRRSVASTEWAINAFLAISNPIEAAETALYMERTGPNGTQRFLGLCEGYRLDPGAWRRQERAFHRRREAEDKIDFYGWHSKPNPLDYAERRA